MFLAKVKRLMPIDVYPIVGIISLAVGGCIYHMVRASTSPDVVLARSHESEPWNMKKDSNGKYLRVTETDAHMIK